MVEFRNTLQTDCCEAGGRQLPPYITALTAFSADSGGGGVLEARAGKNVNRNETKRREREKQKDGKRGQRGLKNRSNWGWEKKEKRRWCKKKKPAVSKTKESAAGVVHEQLVPKTESRTKWVLFGLEQGQSWAGLASRERSQNQKRPTGRSLYNREGKPHRHNRDALDSLMIWLGLNLCQRGRQGDIKKRKKGIYKKAWKKEESGECSPLFMH